MVGKLVELVQELSSRRTKVADLKLTLSRKETTSYLQWKQENPKDRTAMDKVIAELKENDKQWQELEIEYQKAVNDYQRLKDFYNLLEGAMKNPSYEKAFVEDMIKAGGEL